MRSQTEKRNILLDTGGKVTLDIKCQRTRLNSSLVLWKVGVVSEELGSLAEEISKQGIEGGLGPLNCL